MNNNTVTRHDGNWNEEVVGENLSYFEALMLMGEGRSKKDGFFYRIGTPKNIKNDRKYLHHLKEVV